MTSRIGLIFPIFVLAAATRAVPWRHVMTPNGVVLWGGDSYYHMWRIWNSVSRSMPLSARDSFSNFPDGGEILWSPAFDWILATLIWGLGLDLPAAELLCAWVPLILGAASVALAAHIASIAFSRPAGWVTGIMLAILPGSYFYTHLGFLDHHVAVTLIGTIMLGGAMRIVSEGQAGPRFWPILGGGLCALALLTWAGALIHIGILQLALVIWVLETPGRDRTSERAMRLALAHAITAVAILPFSLREWEVFGDFNPLALTRFQPTWYGAGAICLTCAALLWRTPLGRTRVRRLMSAATLGTAGLALAFALIPELAETLDRSADWFTGDVVLLSQIVELRSLVVSGEEFDWMRPVRFLSLLFYFLPFALVAIVWRSQRPERWLLVIWCTVFCALTLGQFRFINTFSVAYAMVMGGAISQLVEWSSIRIFQHRVRVGASVIAVLGLGAIILLPAWSYYELLLRPGGLGKMQARFDAFRATSRWIGDSHPAPLDENGRPTSGLLCAWGVGHEFRYYSGWAVHQDGFGPYVAPENVALANRYFSALDEDEAIAILDQLDTRFVVADILGAGQPPYSPQSMTGRLVRHHGSGTTIYVGPTKAPRWLPALTRHRLVFEAPTLDLGVWLYEIVPGAEFVGSTHPHSQVSAELQLETSSGRLLSWITRQRASETGEFRLRLPYSTIGGTGSAVTPGAAYLLRTNSGSMQLQVTEEAVQTGATITLDRPLSEATSPRLGSENVSRPTNR
jgi:asparagine N-glycosylation enzyme membrane subunit Stt3